MLNNLIANMLLLSKKEYYFPFHNHCNLTWNRRQSPKILTLLPQNHNIPAATKAHVTSQLPIQIKVLIRSYTSTRNCQIFYVTFPKFCLHNRYISCLGRHESYLLAADCYYLLAKTTRHTVYVYAKIINNLIN